MHDNKFKISILLVAFLFLLFFIDLKAQTADELKNLIDSRASQIEKLEKEIAGYQKEIEALSSQSASLSSTIKSLQLTRRKLETNINLTQDKIASKNYEIQRLDSQINNKEENIDDNKRIINKTFLSINELDDQSLAELILGNRSISEALEAFEQLSIIQNGLKEKIEKLNEDKSNLENNKKASEKAKLELVKLNNQLANERSLVVETMAEQADLLKETAESESKYKEMLSKKKAEQLAFQQEISNYESQLKILINPDLIPHTGSGVLFWPLDKVTVTQKFGVTDFSSKNPQFYKTGAHNGVDFRAPIGTPVKSALSGVIAGVGNTGTIPRCLSYGRWVLVKHDNGLSTLYAHLSLPTVVPGQSVGAGEIIAYSGNTGASTGPHLHFGVYASQGLQIIKITKKEFPTVVNCVGSIIPVGKPLDPLLYL